MVEFCEDWRNRYQSAGLFDDGAMEFFGVETSDIPELVQAMYQCTFEASSLILVPDVDIDYGNEEVFWGGSTSQIGNLCEFPVMLRSDSGEVEYRLTPSLLSTDQISCVLGEVNNELSYLDNLNPPLVGSQDTLRGSIKQVPAPLNSIKAGLKVVNQFLCAASFALGRTIILQGLHAMVRDQANLHSCLQAMWTDTIEMLESEGS